jgi:peptidyl-dipeptidase Dcp
MLRLRMIVIATSIALGACSQPSDDTAKQPATAATAAHASTAGAGACRQYQ